MSEPGNEFQSGNDRLTDEAAAWFARMRAPDSELSRAEFDAWMGRSEAHRAAYSRAAEIFAMGKFLGETAQRPKPLLQSSQIRLRPLVSAIVALFAFAGLVAWLATRADHAKPAHRTGIQTAELATAAGERRQVHLADGSLVRLEPGTRIAANFDSSGRTLSLERGQALFAVAHEARPFVVLSGGGSVTARGTVFEVSLATGGTVRVRLVEGSVDVRLPAAATAASPSVRRLRPGESLRFLAEPAASAGTDSAMSMGQAGSHDMTDFENIRLADLAAEANRQSDRKIRFADPALGERRVSGRFGTRDAERLADRLALLFGLEVDRSDSSALVLRAR